MALDATTAKPASPSQLARQLQALIDFNNRFQNLRQIPAILLQAPTISDSLHSVPQSTLLRHELQELKEVDEALCSDKVQGALTVARESEQKDSSGIVSRRRENLKRRRPPSPGSPQPYRPFQHNTPDSFPETSDSSQHVRLQELETYIKECNRTNKAKLHVYSPRSREQLFKGSTRIVLRFIIRDIITIYLAMGSIHDSELILESATAFGPRETRLPHSQSEYTVYQKVSQQIAKVVQSHPEAPLKIIMSLLQSYEGLFTTPCPACHRMLSPDGHLPPVARLWVHEGSDADNGEWQPRHLACLQR